MTCRTWWVLALLALGAGCGNKAAPPAPPGWKPGTVYRTEQAATARGFLDRRGLIHSHSPYSHDACDGAPKDANGNYDQVCYDDFRRGLCQSKHDFDFLTDHPSSFTSGEFPDVLAYRPQGGDVLVTHGKGPSANWLSCPDGAAPVLVMAGTESTELMPVGLEEHAAPEADRRDVYDNGTPANIATIKGKGAVVLVAHTERWTADQLTTLPLDGFEMFNLHASSFKNASVLAELVLNKIDKGDFAGLPVPDAFLAFYTIEDPAYLETWGTTLFRGAHRVTTMGTDCHRNTFPQLMQDGERVDSYRRMMLGFSNHLLVRAKADGTWDDRDLKDALRAGRLYGAFEFMGYPTGFDYTALEAGQLKEMGETASLAKGVTLKATMPAVQGLDSAVEPPVLTLRFLRARDSGWDEVAATSEGTLEYAVTQAGAYRAEVRMIPRHLKPHMGLKLAFIKEARPWVYSNAIYVDP